jgi:hypothetical protein
MTIDTTNGLAVVSAARKLILLVPAGPVVAFPEGAAISEYGQNNTTPVITVCNRTDTSKGPNGTWQGADSENGVIIINEVPEELALRALGMIETARNAFPTTDDSRSKVTALLEVLDFLADNGCGDQYTTSKDFVKSKLSPAGAMLDAFTGIVKRDDRDVCRIVRDAEGVIWVQLPKGEPRHIEADILLRTYVQADGRPINLADIPEVKQAAA